MGRFLDIEAACLPANAVFTDDPMRTRMLVAHHLDFASKVSEQRGLESYTGNYNGVPLSVLSVGFGEASLLGFLGEAVENGVRRVVYLGECVSLGAPPFLGEVVLATQADAAGGSGEPSAALLRNAAQVAGRLGFPVHQLPVVTNDTYWLTTEEENTQEKGVVDFASHALYAYADKNQIEALSVLTVSEQRSPFRQMEAAERQSRFHQAARIAFDTLVTR